MNHLKIVLSYLLILVPSYVFSQSYSDIANQKTGNYSLGDSKIVGLWEVNKVTVGEETLTPTAKWFLFLADGTLSSGNGWVQSMLGSYNYDQDTKELLQANQGVTDEYGPFKVSIEGDKMTWKRTEDGMPLKVNLSKVAKKPLAPWDKIQNRWVVDKAEGLHPETGKLISQYVMDPDVYFFMWDRAYRKFDKTGRTIERGVWHIGGHSNQVWIINNADNVRTRWTLELLDDQMIWTKKSEKETLKVYLKKEL